VEEVVAYRTTQGSSQELARAALKTGVDVVTFTSSSTVRYLVELLEGDIAPLRQAVVACIGPTTAQTAREAGFQVHITAAEHTVSGLVNSLAEYFPQRGVQ
jgi:uroporphyrinogen-III synthase